MPAVLPQCPARGRCVGRLEGSGAELLALRGWECYAECVPFH